MAKSIRRASVHTRTKKNPHANSAAFVWLKKEKKYCGMNGIHWIFCSVAKKRLNGLSHWSTWFLLAAIRSKCNDGGGGDVERKDKKINCTCKVDIWVVWRRKATVRARNCNRKRKDRKPSKLAFKEFDFWWARSASLGGEGKEGRKERDALHLRSLDENRSSVRSQQANVRRREQKREKMRRCRKVENQEPRKRCHHQNRDKQKWMQRNHPQGMCPVCVCVCVCAKIEDKAYKVCSKWKNRKWKETR